MNQLSLRQPCKGHNSARNKFLSLNESLGFETETRYSRRSNFFCNMLRAIKTSKMDTALRCHDLHHKIQQYNLLA